MRNQIIQSTSMIISLIIFMQIMLSISRWVQPKLTCLSKILTWRHSRMRTLWKKLNLLIQHYSMINNQKLSTLASNPRKRVIKVKAITTTNIAVQMTVKKHRLRRPPKRSNLSLRRRKKKPSQRSLSDFLTKGQHPKRRWW